MWEVGLQEEEQNGAPVELHLTDGVHELGQVTNTLDGVAELASSELESPLAREKAVSKM